MSAQVKDFLGVTLSIPEDRLYDAAEGLWLKRQPDGAIAVGLTEPALLMAGQVREIERLVEQGVAVVAGETVLLGLTSRLKYIACPISGTLTFPETPQETVSRLMEDPYNTVLFFVEPSADEAQCLSDGPQYAEFLKASEGARNPKGMKGGVSPTCKAVYMGLGQQKLSD